MTAAYQSTLPSGSGFKAICLAESPAVSRAPSGAETSADYSSDFATLIADIRPSAKGLSVQIAKRNQKISPFSAELTAGNKTPWVYS
jgi:hypothetical protein